MAQRRMVVCADHFFQSDDSLAGLNAALDHPVERAAIQKRRLLLGPHTGNMVRCRATMRLYPTREFVHGVDPDT